MTFLRRTLKLARSSMYSATITASDDPAAIDPTTSHDSAAQQRNDCRALIKRCPPDFRQSNDENSKTIEPCQIMDLRVVGRHPVCLVDLAEPKFHLNAGNKPGHVTRADGNKTHSGPTPPARPSEGALSSAIGFSRVGDLTSLSGALKPPPSPCPQTP